MSVPHVSITAGVEVEAGVYKDGRPFDVKRFLASYGGSLEVPGYGTIGCDLGPNQVEFITGVCRSGDEVEHRLRALESALQGLVSGLRVVYGPYLPAHHDVDDLLAHPHQHPRVVAQIAGLRCEWEQKVGDDTWRRVSNLARACSTHVHIGLCDEYGVFRKHTEPGFFDLYLALKNVHTACGPVYARRLAERSGIVDHPERQLVWFQFTTKQRQPCKGTWLHGSAAYVARIRSAGPRLVRRGYDGVREVETWAVDLETPSWEEDPIVLKTCWDQGRLSPLGTVESRSGQSVPPEHAGWYAQKLIEVSRGTIEWLQQHSLDTTSDVECLFQYLCTAAGNFVPSFPLTEHEWWRCANFLPH